ncbi:MAG: NIF family HAD-type phosphatase [Spirochaetota bacterium]|nr:NIF family HAD-type phosphatase [Spirochaetota bacterium]
MISHIIFDMDGTLFSSEDMIVPTYERGIRSFNEKHPGLSQAIPTQEELISLLGFPINHIYQTLFPDLSPDKRKEIRALILARLIEAIRNREGILYQGVEETLNSLYDKSYQLYIASNGQSEYLEAILETYDLKKLFHPIITLNYRDICDKGDILLSYQKKHQFDRATVVMVGDRDSDWEASRKLGSGFMACDYGHGHPSETDQADIILRAFPEILSHL